MTPDPWSDIPALRHAQPPPVRHPPAESPFRPLLALPVIGLALVLRGLLFGWVPHSGGIWGMLVTFGWVAAAAMVSTLWLGTRAGLIATGVGFTVALGLFLLPADTPITERLLDFCIAIGLTALVLGLSAALRARREREEDAD